MEPASVTVLSQVDREDTSRNTSADLSLPQPSFRKELQDLDDKWSIRMSRLETLLTLGQHPTPQPSFSPVKAPVEYKPPAGALSQTPFLMSAVHFGQAGPASGLDRAQTSTPLEMSSPLENLYPEADLEPVFAQPGLVSSTEPVTDPLPVSVQDVLPPEQFEEGKVSNPEDQPEPDAGDR